MYQLNSEWFPQCITWARAPVKKSSSILKHLGMGQDVQIVYDSTTAQIKEILAQTAITGALPLPLAHMSQGMLDSHSFAQLAPSLRGLLALT
jgi:hypothetical protein